MNNRAVSVSLEELSEFAIECAKTLQGGEEWGLRGPLGAGKTTLVRQLVLALGGDDTVSSPTFVLCHEHSLPQHSLLIEHWDLYRLTCTPEELESPPSSGVLRLIEWPERASGLMERLTGEIVLEIPPEPLSSNTRNISIESFVRGESKSR